MKIAFVFAPYRHKLFSENLKVVDDDFGVFPPINLGYAAAIAERAGHEVMMIDANAERLTTAKTIARLVQFNPQAVGFYFSTYMFHDTLAWAREIKQALQVPILAGGINMLLYPRESLHQPIIDYGLSGQAVRVLPELLSAIESGDPPDIPGVCYRRDGEIVFRPAQNSDFDFDDYPYPARHLLPNERYFSITSQLRNFTAMVTTMGCPQSCTFCAIAPLKLQSRTVDNVLDEMQDCAERFQVKEIDNFDADFPYNRQRTEKICQGLLSRDLSLEWSCRARVDSVDKNLLELMQAAGCRKIYLGIETPNKHSLELMKKKITLERVSQVIADAKRVGIRSLGFFMTGVPGENRKSLLDTIRFALGLDLDFAQFSRTIAKPGSELNQEIVNRGGRDYWRDFVMGLEPERRLGSPWTKLSEREIEFWTKAAYFAFFFRPTQIAKTVGKVRSTDELGRGVRTALHMIRYALKQDTSV